MDQPETKDTNNQTTTQEPAARPWVTPTFERTELKAALTHTTGQGTDLNISS